MDKPKFQIGDIVKFGDDEFRVTGRSVSCGGTLTTPVWPIVLIDQGARELFPVNCYAPPTDRPIEYAAESELTLIGSCSAVPAGCVVKAEAEGKES